MEQESGPRSFCGATFDAVSIALFLVIWCVLFGVLVNAAGPIRAGMSLLLLLDVLLFYAKFIASKSVGGASKDLESFSTSATTVFTAGTVIAMLLIVVVILVDRVAFLSHSHRLKMLLTFRHTK